MSHHSILRCGAGVGLWLIVACTPNNVALGPNDFEVEESRADMIEIEAAREEVFTVQAGQQETIPLSERISLEAGQSVVVDEDGRAILYFGDMLTLELLQGAEIQVRDFEVAERPTVTVIQNGGTLVADLTTEPDLEKRFDLQTAFSTISASAGRFAVVRTLDSPLEWVVVLEAAEGDLQIKTGAETRSVVGGQAYWIAPAGEIGPTISAGRGVEAWLNGARNDATQPELREILLSPANMLADMGAIDALPARGEAVELSSDVQGVVNLSLDPKGIFGSPTYALTDCNGDGVQDLAIQNGILALDFRQLLARVQAIDATVLNRDQPGRGLLRALDPAGSEIGQQQLQVGEGLVQTLSLRSDQPFHSAELIISDACFLGVSLTPPVPGSKPVAVRPTSETVQSDVVVNILEASSERTPENGELQAPSVGEGDLVGPIEIDGSQSDWEAVARQSGVDWTPFSTITYDEGCATRYVDAEDLTDLAGRVQLAYDDQYLYVAFAVTDDGLVPYSGADERYFLGDSPQLLLDLDLNGDIDASQLSGDDVQIDLKPSVEAAQAALWQLGTLSSRPLAEAPVAVSPTNTGYFVEAAVPWQALNLKPQPGDRLGFVASINDNDTPDTNAQECIISTSPQRDWRDPTTWGTLLLLPDTGN